MRIKVSTLILWGTKGAAEEVNHYLIDFLLDKISKKVIR